MCRNLGRIYDPGSQELDAVCPTCHGAGWVDPSLVCYCGRAATILDDKSQRWYCGAVLCEPEKHPKQNAQRDNPTAPSEDVDAEYGWHNGWGHYY
jgi:hypothetical protein